MGNEMWLDNDMSTTQQLTEAISHRDAARLLMNASKVGSKAWRNAEEELDFWQGKVAMLSVMVERGI